MAAFAAASALWLGTVCVADPATRPAPASIAELKTAARGGDSTAQFNLGVRYSNYSGNRFPGHARGTNQGSFRDGSITLSWNVEW